MNNNIISVQLLSDIRQLLTHVHQSLLPTVKTTMVQTYWHIGCITIKHEQQCQAHAECEKNISGACIEFNC